MGTFQIHHPNPFFILPFPNTFLRKSHFGINKFCLCFYLGAHFAPIVERLPSSSNIGFAHGIFTNHTF
jgi:hypothetical protein